MPSSFAGCYLSQNDIFCALAHSSILLPGCFVERCLFVHEYTCEKERKRSRRRLCIYMIAHNKERNQQLASYLGHRRISSELLLFLLNCNDLRFIRCSYLRVFKRKKQSEVEIAKNTLRSESMKNTITRRNHRNTNNNISITTQLLANLEKLISRFLLFIYYFFHP